MPPDNAPETEEPASVAPLTPEEIALFQTLAGGINKETLHADARAAETALADAVQGNGTEPAPPVPNPPQNRQNNPQNSTLHTQNSTLLTPRTPTENTEEENKEEEPIENKGCNQYRHSKDCKGHTIHARKGGRSTKGKTHTQSQKEDRQSQVDDVEKALKTTAKKGKRTVTVQGKPLLIEAGHPDYAGTRHAARHFSPKQTDERKTAKALVLGEREKVDGGIAHKRRMTTAITKQDKKSNDKFITAYKHK